MSRLIDADKLIDYFYYGQDDKPIIDGYADRKIIEIIKEQPTAYDIEKVVAELEELKARYETLCRMCSNIPVVNYDLGRYEGVFKAIEIVKRGGIRD